MRADLVASGDGRLRLWIGVALAAVIVTWSSASVAGSDPWLDRLVAFGAGENAGFGQSDLTSVVLGPPEGGGALQGGTDVLSLGTGGSVTVAFRDNLVFDGPGDDLVVFENPFFVGDIDGQVFTEYGFVEVSADGREFVRFPFDPGSGEGLAGRTPVLSNSGNGLDPLSSDAGGDRFDLADIGLRFVRFVRLVDAGSGVDDVGNHVASGDKAGFDLDAAAAINSTPPARVRGTVTIGGHRLEGVRVRLIPSDGGKKLRRRSRWNGRFRFRRVIPSGDYTLRARSRVYGIRSASVYVDLEQLSVTSHLDFGEGP